MAPLASRSYLSYTPWLLHIVRAQEIIPIRAAHALLAGGIVFDLDSDAADATLITQVRDLCASHNGAVPAYVRIHTPDDGTFVIKAGVAMRVEPSAPLLDAARKLVGDGRVRYIPHNGNGGANGNGNRARPRRRRRNGTAAT